MAYLTDRKRATGQGSARSGVRRHWRMIISAVALAVLTPLFVFTFGGILGADHATVTAYYARPFPAIVAALTLVVGFIHFRTGVQTMIEDYTKGATRTVLIIAAACISYTAITAGLFALVRLAL